MESTIKTLRSQEEITAEKNVALDALDDFSCDLLKEMEQTIHALSGVCDLLVGGAPGETLHEVDPNNLYFLLELVRRRQQRITDTLFDVQLKARAKAENHATEA